MLPIIIDVLMFAVISIINTGIFYIYYYLTTFSNIFKDKPEKIISTDYIFAILFPLLFPVTFLLIGNLFYVSKYYTYFNISSIYTISSIVCLLLGIFSIIKGRRILGFCMIIAMILTPFLVIVALYSVGH